MCFFPVRVLQDALNLFRWNITNIDANRLLVLRRFALHFLFYYDLSWQFAFVNSSISHLRQLALLKWRFISEGFVCTHLNINLMDHKLCLRAGTLWGWRMNRGLKPRIEFVNLFVSFYTLWHLQLAYTDRFPCAIIKNPLFYELSSPCQSMGKLTSVKQKF